MMDYYTVHNALVSQFPPISGTNLTLVRRSVNSIKGDNLSVVWDSVTRGMQPARCMRL